jgi:acetylornithine aminotransferase
LTPVQPRSGPSTSYQAVTHSPTAPSDATKDKLTRASAYLLPVYARPDLILSHGKGSYVWDVDGRKFLDFGAGIAVNALGHADEGVAQVSLKKNAIFDIKLNLWTTVSRRTGW